MGIIRTGCSGFYNKHWKEIFYPEKLPAEKWFDFYVQHFKALELNVTFYQFPTIERLKTWHDKCPDDFIFSVKAPRLITHTYKLKNCEQQINDFYEVCEKGLKEKLGCFLFQFPPNLKYSEEELEAIIRVLNAKYKTVVEFRHASWWNQKVYNVLGEKNITFCSIDHPKLPADLIINTLTVYIRLHGNPELFHSNYETDMLKNLHKKITNNKQIKEIYVYFNNTASTAGVLNALEFQKF